MHRMQPTVLWLCFAASAWADAVPPAAQLVRGRLSGKVVGPLGLEPRTKGFTSAPPFPEGVDYLFTPEGCGTL